MIILLLGLFIGTAVVFGLLAVGIWRKQQGITRWPGTVATTLALLAECFEELGSVPGILLTDRMGCLRATVANVVVPHPEYVQFCAQYTCRPDFCEAADPESKGIVEHLSGYAQTACVTRASRLPVLQCWSPPPTR